MDNDITTKEDTEFQEALDSMPEDVRDYMWSPAFDYTIDVAQKVLELSVTEKEYVRDISYDLLMRLIDMEAAAKKLIDKEIPPEKVSKIMYFIYQEIMQSAENIAAYYGDTEQTQNSSTEESPKTRPTDGSTDAALANLGARLSQTSIIAPEKRTYSIQKESTPTPPPTTEKKFDPYHEPVDEK